MTGVVKFTELWTAHVRDCPLCEAWWLSRGFGLPTPVDRGYVRCTQGFAISEVLEVELEREMPIPDESR